MKSDKFVKMAKDIANNYKTLYVLGCFGSPLNATNKKRYTTNNAYNKKRAKIINSASSNTFGFDCVCLIKGILWGWNGNKNNTYGGAKYCSNGVPDVGANEIMNYCSGVSSNFKDIVPGEIVHMPGHVGIYIGSGLAVECSPKWKNRVQITAVGNIGKKHGYNTRVWTNHGKLKFINYKKIEDTKETNIATSKKGYTGKFPSLGIKGYLKKGDKGKQVKRLQEFLNWCINAKLNIDGSFGPATEKAVKKYQKKYGLVEDGNFGPASLKKAKSIKK